MQSGLDLVAMGRPLSWHRVGDPAGTNGVRQLRRATVEGYVGCNGRLLKGDVWDENPNMIPGQRWVQTS